MAAWTSKLSDKNSVVSVYYGHFLCNKHNTITANLLMSSELADLSDPHL